MRISDTALYVEWGTNGSGNAGPWGNFACVDFHLVMHSQHGKLKRDCRRPSKERAELKPQRRGITPWKHGIETLATKSTLPVSGSTLHDDDSCKHSSLPGFQTVQVAIELLDCHQSPKEHVHTSGHTKRKGIVVMTTSLRLVEQAPFCRDQNQASSSLDRVAC